MPGKISHFKPLIIGALEAALNRYLTLDEQIDLLLTPIAGKVIAIRFTPFDQTVYLCPSNETIQVLESYHGKVDATLTGSLLALGLMGLSATPMHALFKGKVRIEGDMAVAHKLQDLFAKLDINLEGKLARYTGDNFAQKLNNMFRNTRDWSRYSVSTFQLNLEEFLQEETRDLPAKSEAEFFFQQVDACRCDYDRLNARIERLILALGKYSDSQNQKGPQS